MTPPSSPPCWTRTRSPRPSRATASATGSRASPSARTWPRGWRSPTARSSAGCARASAGRSARRAWGRSGPSSCRARGGRGLGGALYEVAHAHLLDVGARVLGSWTTAEAGARFLSARGYAASRTQEILRLDVASADLSGLDGLRARLERDGYELVPLSAVADRVDELYALDAGATADVPGTFAEDDVRLEDWLAEAIAHPQLSHEGSTVVLLRGEPVAYSLPARRAGVADGRERDDGNPSRPTPQGARSAWRSSARSPGRGRRATRRSSRRATRTTRGCST